VKRAVLLASGASSAEAERVLEQHRGNLRHALVALDGGGPQGATMRKAAP
jgi:N-acetylmuramic acid 6-phosphate (MurNAc-6-P) etherase